MIIIDPEKYELMEQNHKAEDTSSAATGTGTDRRSLRRQRRKKRFLKSFLHSIGFFLLFLGLKAFTRRRYNVWSFDDGGESHYPHGRPHHRHGHGPGHPRHRLSTEEREKLFLSIPNPESAVSASREYATHPHLAGSSEDFSDAKTILQLFQTHFNIPAPPTEPIFPAGTPESRKATLGLTSSSGLGIPSAWIDIYYPVLNTPLDRSLDILGEDGQATWSADLVEDGDPLDEDAHKYKDAVPTWHGLSRDGDVEGQLIYANYGTKEDYDNLVSAGANLTGKIVIARYGSIFRGLKIKRAEELGAVGVLIYSDPRDDGLVTLQNGYAPYPTGPARNPTSVQRGSVQYISMYPGDPTTPGYPAYEDADRAEGENIPKIPSLPISWKNAERLLEEIGDAYSKESEGRKTVLSGKVSETRIRLVNHVDTKVTPIWNTMASIPGHIRNEVVLIGCHRDAWVLGAADPISGTVSLHEVIRGFGALLKKGWKPLRTVVFASWDAEEYGLVGSTEWGEDFPSWISDHVVAYLNVDVSVAGSKWHIGGSPSLAHLIKQTALDVPHPTIKGKTLWDARDDEGPFTGIGDESAGKSNSTGNTDFMASYEAAEKERQASKTGISALGSGSDYTVFLQRLGVASTDQGFRGTPSDAVYHYHSVYDSQRWQETYADPGFLRHVAVAKHLGLLGLRLIDSIVLPLNTTQYAFELDQYLDKVESLIPKPSVSRSPDFATLRTSISKLQSASAKLDAEKEDAEKTFKHLLNKLPPFPHRKGPCKRRSGFFNRAANWIKSVFGVSPESYGHEGNQLGLKARDTWEEYLDYEPDVGGESHSPWTGQPPQPQHERPAFPSDLPHPPPGPHNPHDHPHPPHYPPHFPHKFPIHKFIKAAKRVAKANKKLIDFERGFISEGGIKDREWYKHLGVAPGKWLGYGATTLPALTEALAIDNNVTLAEYEAGRLTDLIDKLTNRIQS